MSTALLLVVNIYHKTKSKQAMLLVGGKVVDGYYRIYAFCKWSLCENEQVNFTTRPRAGKQCSW